MSLPPAFTTKTIESTCTVWIGACNNLGYGVLYRNGKHALAHRVAYEAEHGPIPDGMVLDHLCRVRNCVRVDHLEPVTHKENTRRGRNARALTIGDECQNGHLINTADDLYIKPSNGASECMECRRDGRRRNRQGEARPTRQKRADKVRADIERVA